jgi:hypothetical protein
VFVNPSGQDFFIPGNATILADSLATNPRNDPKPNIDNTPEMQHPFGIAQKNR